MRLPRHGGSAQLLDPNTLGLLGWRSARGVPPIARGLGMAVEDEMVFAVDTAGRMIGIDLQSKLSNVVLGSVRQLTGTSDGAILGIDSSLRAVRYVNRQRIVFNASVPARGSRLLRAPNGRIVAIDPEGTQAHLLGSDGELRKVAIPSGTTASTWFGDVLAVAADSGVTLVSFALGDSSAPRFVRVRGEPTAVAFSPSGHRLYVARKRHDIVVLDRFELTQLRTIELPGDAADVRVDRSGRWLLARPGNGDAVWAVDLVRGEVAATVTTPWRDDLPVVTGGRTLVMREGRDVTAWDLTATTPALRGRLPDAAEDVYIAIPWPRSGQLQAPPAVAAAAAAPDTTSPVTAPVVATAPASDTAQHAATAAAPAGNYMVQVSSSQNREWADLLAKQLRDGGMPAKVLDPAKNDDGYRVVIGPYPSRDDADAAGKRLGRSYFIISPDGNDR